MKRQGPAHATPPVGALVRQARLARRWTLIELAERSRVSTATLKRIEGGALSTSLGAWRPCLSGSACLPGLTELRDPASQALLDETRAKRSRRKLTAPDLDFRVMPARTVFIWLPAETEAVSALVSRA